MAPPLAKSALDLARTAELLGELKRLAEAGGHRDLAYFIGMAQLEASEGASCDVHNERAA